MAHYFSPPMPGDDDAALVVAAGPIVHPADPPVDRPAGVTTVTDTAAETSAVLRVDAATLEAGLDGAASYAPTDDETLRANARQLADPHSTPPFVGPVGPVQLHWRGLALRAARESATHVIAGTLSDYGFYRIDRLPDGEIWTTSVHDDGTVISTIGSVVPPGVPAEVRPEVPPEVPTEAQRPWEQGPDLEVPNFDHDDPWRSFRRAAARFDESDPTIVARHTQPGWVVYYRRDPATGGLNAWTLDELEQVQSRVYYPAAPKGPDDYRDVDLPLRGPYLWRLARTLADAINQRGRDERARQSLDSALDALRDHLDGVGKELRRRRAALTLNPRFYREEWEEALHRAISQLHGSTLTAKARFIAVPPTARAVSADPREIYRQLRAFAAEFKDPTVNFGTQTLGGVIPGIVLRDKDTDVEVAFGDFRLVYDYSQLDAQSPPVDCFRARALQPRYPLDDPTGSRKTTHPHVSGGGICLGTAVNPVAAALKHGQLLDAFLIVRSVLTTYGDKAHPYVTPWRWVYTQKQYQNIVAERQRAQPGPAVRCPGCGLALDRCTCDEDQDDEGSRCDTCDHSLDDCTCQECGNCGDMFDAEDDGGHCGHCDESYCDACGGECDCGGCEHDRCNNCAISCDNCSNSHVCQDCRTFCHAEDCHSTLCADCARDCLGCRDSFCSGCLAECAGCEQELCPNCMDEHGQACACCDERCCDRKAGTCPACTRTVCTDCLRVPAAGLEPTCPDCMAVCTRCHQEFGRQEIVSDGLCPACFHREAMANRARRQILSDYFAARAALRLRPDEDLLVGILPVDRGVLTDALAYHERMRGRPGAIQDDAPVPLRRRPGARHGDGDHPADPAGAPAADGAGPAGALAGDEGRPAAPPVPPAETGRERGFYRDANGQIQSGWIYPELPLFNLDPPAEGEAA